LVSMPFEVKALTCSSIFAWSGEISLRASLNGESKSYPRHSRDSDRQFCPFKLDSGLSVRGTEAGNLSTPYQPKTATFVCQSCGADIEVPLSNGMLPQSMKCSKCGFVYHFPPPQQQANQWTPEQVESLIKLVDTLSSKYITYKDKEAEADHRALRTVTRHSTYLTIILATFLGVIVFIMSELTYVGKVSGDALLFLVGTITGYILLFIQRLTKMVLGDGSSEDEGE